MRKSIGGLMVLALLAGACSGGGDDAAPATTTAVTTTTSTTTTAPPTTTTVDLDALADAYDATFDGTASNAVTDRGEDVLDVARDRIDEAIASGDPNEILLLIEESYRWENKVEEPSANFYAIVRDLRMRLENAYIGLAAGQVTDAGPVLASFALSDVDGPVLVERRLGAYVLRTWEGELIGHIRADGNLPAALFPDPIVAPYTAALWPEPRRHPVQEPLDPFGAESIAAAEGGQFFTGYSFEAGDSSYVLDVATGEVTESPEGCIVTDADGERQVAICDLGDDELAQLAWWDDGIASQISGPVWGTEFPVFGSYRFAQLGPSGAVLALWSGECEVPSAHLVVSGEPLAVLITGDAADPGLELGVVDPTTSDVAQSWPLGWAPDGRALILVSDGPCSNATPNGVYAAGTDGSLELVFATNDTAWLISD